MKRTSKSGRKTTKNRRNLQNRARNRPNDHVVTELLKMCLEKVVELQEDLRRCDEEENDPEAAGYAACAMETLRFLSAEGLSSDHPVVQTLTKNLLGERDEQGDEQE